MNRSSLQVVIGVASLVAFGCSRQEPDFTGIDPDILQFHILADAWTDRALIDVATARQKSEESDGKPWSDEVHTTNEPARLVGLWMEVSDRAYDEFKSNSRTTLRERPGKEGQPPIKQVLVVLNPNDINRHDIAWMDDAVDEHGNPCVDFEMTKNGAEKLARLTGENVPDTSGQRRHLGIFVDGIMMSAPTINSTISDRGQITGHFTKREVEDLVVFLSVAKITEDGKIKTQR